MLGHAGVVTIDRQGNTRYCQYGRYDKAAMGLVQEIRHMPSVQFGANGYPTPASMEKLLSYISTEAGQRGPIAGAYFKDNHTAKMNAYADDRLAEIRMPRANNTNCLQITSLRSCAKCLLLAASGRRKSGLPVRGPTEYIDALQRTEDLSGIWSRSGDVYGLQSFLFGNGGRLYIDGMYMGQ